MNDIHNGKTLVKQRRGGFQPGQSGNPMGRPKKNATNTGLKSISATEKLLAKGVKGVAETVLKLATNGDMAAAKLVLDRISPPRKGRLTTFPMRPITSQADVADALQGLLEATAQGFLTPTESTELAAIVERLGKALADSEIEARLAKLERLTVLGQ